MDKMIKLAVLIGALLAGGAIFYHYVIFLPEVERRKEEQPFQLAQLDQSTLERLQQERAAARKAEQEKVLADPRHQAAEREYLRNRELAIQQEQARRKALADYLASPEGQAALRQEAERLATERELQANPTLRQKFLEMREKARLDAEAEARKRQSALRQKTFDLCQASARRNHEANWASRCELLREQNLSNCLASRSIIDRIVEMFGVPYCERNYGQKNPSPKCSLPEKLADSINKTYSDDQQKCLAEARLDLK